MTGKPTTDESLVRSAAIRVGIQLAAACAVVVVIVAVTALLVGHHAHHSVPLPDGDGDLDDDDFFGAVLIAGGIGILIAGAIGWFAARSAVRPLAEALRLQKRFVADAGHELRTPLTILHTRAQLLGRKITADDPAKPLSDQLLRDSRVLAEIVDELLASAQLAANPAHAVAIDLTDLVNDVADSIAPLASDAGISIIPTAAPGSEVDGSPTSLRRALLALVDNSIAHTPAGGSIWITVRAPDPAHVVIEVTDNGEGLDPDDAPRLTERFARGSAIGGASSGLSTGSRRFGLGLALVREVVDAHGGSLHIAGEPGVGASISISLPIAKGAA